MRIVSITAGAAGMFCGSCMRDNTLAVALIALGHDALLVPTYTPITTDEPDATAGRTVFFGGVNVFLQQSRFTSWAFRRTPRFVDAMLNNRAFLKWVGRYAERTDYSKLGGLTTSMLRGVDGNQRKEVAKLIDWLKAEIKPDVVLMSNALLSGMVPELKKRLNVPILTTLQGDDIFLDELPDADRRRCIELIRANDKYTAAYICTSAAYADHMADYLGLDRAKMHVVYPGINTQAYTGIVPRPADRPPTIGYFARLAPEKGFHNLVDAFILLAGRANDGYEPVNSVSIAHPFPGSSPSLARPANGRSNRIKLKFAGWLGAKNKPYLDKQLAKLDAAGLRADVEWVPCPDLASKARFFQSIDVLSVPTTYREPKGLYVLEAWANGVPVVQPDHGSFPELIGRTGGGVLVPPNDAPALADALSELLEDPVRRERLGRAGYDGVKAAHEAHHMAAATLAVLNQYVAGGPG